MNEKAIRWKQRIAKLSKAFGQLREAVDAFNSLSVLEKEGLVQRFEYTFELAWKTLTDYLESQDVEAKFPREVIKKGFQYGLLDDGETWLELLEKRNQMAHTYDEVIFKASVSQIVDRFFPEIDKLNRFFQSQIDA